MYLIGYDIGSSSVKAAIVDAATGKTVASDFFPKSEAPIKSLKPGWAEQSPRQWLAYLKEATDSVLKSSRVSPADIRAIGISYQMHGLVLVDSEGSLLRDAVIWCDSRGVPYGDKAFMELGPDFVLPRLLNSPGNFTASKLGWVKQNEPDTFDRIYKIMLPGDYIAYRLTGEMATTVSGLSEMMLWDFEASAPAKFLMDYFGFSPDILPDLRPTFSEQGRLTPQAAEWLGLAPGTPVTYRAGDQPNNALSLNVFNPGEIASTGGTSGVVYGINCNVDYDPQSRVNNFAHVNHTPEAPRIGVMTCINGCGILNSWCKRNIVAPGLSYNDMNEIASRAPVGSGGVAILPFGNGAERVLRNRQVGCSINGLNFNTHNQSHILRAAQEGIVFSFMYGMEIMEKLGLKAEKINAGNANMFLSPIFRDTLASVSGATINLYETDGAVGAAKGAGIGAGIYKNNDEAFSTLVKIKEIRPSASRAPYLEAYERWKEVLEQTTN